MKKIFIVRTTDWHSDWYDRNAYTNREDAVKRQQELEEQRDTCYEETFIDEFTLFD